MCFDLHEMYYSPKGSWRGRAAITKLAHSAGVSEAIAKEYLGRQGIWIIYLPRPSLIHRQQFINDTPNDTNQVDILYLPFDKVRGKRY